jgi:hypothetical protein
MFDHLNVSTALVRMLRGAVLVVCAVLLMPLAHAAQKTFGSAEEAADALVQAAKAGDRNAVLAILGTDVQKWIFSADAVADRELAQKFVSAYEQQHAISPDSDTRSTLVIGSNEWPFAFPLVKAGARWHFDTEAGKREMLARRIGENELSVINVMLAIVDAQKEYASADRNRNGVLEYARKFESTSGGKDGLYWQAAAGEPPSPLGSLVTAAAKAGYSKKEGPTPYHGYYFRMLTKQGRNANGGTLDYIVKGLMIGGFAAVAYPAQYGNTGVMTFIVNHDGVVYEKDLGPKTAELARAMTQFDPGSGWKALPEKP